MGGGRKRQQPREQPQRKHQMEERKSLQQDAFLPMTLPRAPPTPPLSSCSSPEPDYPQDEEEGADTRQGPRERLLMREWLEEQLIRGDIPGFSWKNKDQGVFQIPWKHAARQGWAQGKDALLFRRWAEHTGKYSEDSMDANAKRWKANFRCAINSLPDVEEVKEQSQKKGHNAAKVYRFLLPKEHRRSRRAVQGELRKRCSSRADSQTSCPARPAIRRRRQPSRRRTKTTPSEQKEMARVKVESFLDQQPSGMEVKSESPLSAPCPGDRLPPVHCLVKHDDDCCVGADADYEESTPSLLQEHSYSAPGFDHIHDVGQELEVSSSPFTLSGGRVQVLRRDSTCSLPYTFPLDGDVPMDVGHDSGMSSDEDSHITDENLTDFILSMEGLEGGCGIELVFNNTNETDHNSSSIPTTVMGRAMATMYDASPSPRPNLEIRLPMTVL